MTSGFKPKIVVVEVLCGKVQNLLVWPNLILLNEYATANLPKFQRRILSYLFLKKQIRNGQFFVIKIADVHSFLHSRIFVLNFMEFSIWVCGILYLDRIGKLILLNLRKFSNTSGYSNSLKCLSKFIFSATITGYYKTRSSTKYSHYENIKYLKLYHRNSELTTTPMQTEGKYRP
jgi:hypothetical protein